jgi:hypothetical protein
MAEIGPWMITARSREHAEYVVRSRAEQRGVHVTDVSATGGENNMWLVTATVAEPVDQAQAARLGDDTGVIHFDNHGRFGRASGR